MRSLFLFPVLLAGALSAQTEIHRAVGLPSYKDLKFPPLPAPKIPVPATFTLPNGMKLYLLEDHNLPLVSGVALVRTGNLFDPPDKRGLAQMTGDVLRSGGTKAKSGDQIDVELENIAASVESQIGESSGTVSFSTLKENTDEVLSVFKSLLTAPEFRPDRVELERTQIRSSIARRNDDPNGILSREFASLLYGRNTPYGWNIDYAHIDKIQRQDLIDFYHRYYFPSNIMLAVYGDFSAPEMHARIERMFADWTVKQAPVPKFPELQKTPVPGVFVATKTDVTQTFFAVGHLGGILRDKDYPPLEVAAEILGGGFSSRLFQRIRTKLGYAYGISANWGANYDHPGLFEIGGSTQSARTVDTLKAVREELDRIRTEPVSDDELRTAKDTVLNGFVFNFDRPSKTLNRLLMYEYYGYPKDFIFQYQKAIDSVTKNDVLRVAKEYFKPSDLTVVAVGNPGEFKTPLSELGFKVQDIDLTIPSPAKKPAAASPSPGNAQQGLQLLHKMQAALGGVDKLAAVKDASYEAEVSIQTGAGAMKAKQRNSFIRPSIMRQDVELPFGKQSVYLGGDSGWLASPQGVQDKLPEPVIKQMQGEQFRHIFSLALSDRDAGRTVTAIGPNKIEIADKQGNSAQIELDAAGLPLKLSYEGQMAVSSHIDEEYSDWRDTDGLKLPFQVVVFQGGKKFAEGKILTYKVNSGLSVAGLSKKP